MSLGNNGDLNGGVSVDHQCELWNLISAQRGLPPVWLTLGVCSNQAASAVVQIISNSIGVSLPRARCRRRRLYLVSIQVTIARRRSSRVSQRRVLRKRKA